MNHSRPITIVIVAMGGEGGGVLKDWLVDAAQAAGFPVQATSIPGVAQRTGATTYYVEMFPVPADQLGGKRPVLALAPSLGQVDLVIATELMEAARAVTRGLATSDRTWTVASTHRVLAVDEKVAQGDGRMDPDALLAAICAGNCQSLLFDMEQAARSAGSIINAVLLGAVAGCGALPLPPQSFADCIRAGGKAVDSNLRGFELGLAAALGDIPPALAPQKRAAPDRTDALVLVARAHAELPDLAQAMAEEGARRLAGFQDAAYARLYLDRLAAVWAAERQAGGIGQLTRTVAKHLAVRMSFDDVIKVAAAKIAPDRLDRIRAELGAQPGQPVRVFDYLKPGLDEICGLLPPLVARPLLRLGGRHRLQWGMRISSSGWLGRRVFGFLAGLKGLRRRGYRYGLEQAAIGEWLDGVVAACALSPALAHEVAECAQLFKGYGETWERSNRSYNRIWEGLVRPALGGGMAVGKAVDAIASARVAARKDPDGAALDQTLAQIRAA
jgi:indolepyruvate ferredoxin oxidoreductase beta subunit